MNEIQLIYFISFIIVMAITFATYFLTNDKKVVFIAGGFLIFTYGFIIISIYPSIPSIGLGMVYSLLYGAYLQKVDTKKVKRGLD